MTDTMESYLALKAVSAGVLRTLIDECPYAAWWSSPFNPTPPPSDDTDASDAGTICHSILLEGSTANVAVFDPADYPNLKGGGTAQGWTNKAIKEARDLARGEGKIPVLKADFSNIAETVFCAQRFLKDCEPAVREAFMPAKGASEVTITHEDCKIRPDRIAMDNSIIIDAKFPANSTDPESWSRGQLIGKGYYLSAAFYQRVVEAATGVRPEYVFLVTPTESPHLPFLVGVEPQLLDLGHRKIDYALRSWRKCMKEGKWPAYEPRIYYAECPPWESARWEERETMNPLLGSQG